VGDARRWVVLDSGWRRWVGGLHKGFMREGWGISRLVEKKIKSLAEGIEVSCKGLRVWELRRNRDTIRVSILFFFLLLKLKRNLNQLGSFKMIT
jgi:hypothetical protein